MAASFDSYKIFYFAAKYGNITHAASALFLSQSTVSRTIQSLEAELGCRLFTRFQHGVELTEEGRTLYQHVSKGCEQIFSGEERLKQRQRSGQECLRIGVTEFTFNYYVLPVLPGFCAQYPNVQLEFRTQRAPEDEVFSALSIGALDFLCTISPFTDAPDFTVDHFDFFSDVLVGGERFRELCGAPQELSLLQSCPVAAYARFGRVDDMTRFALGLSDPSVMPRFRVDSALHFIALTKLGLCLSILPEPAYQALKDKNALYKIPLVQPLPRRSACIATLKDHPISPACAELIRLIRQTSSADASNIE